MVYHVGIDKYARPKTTAKTRNSLGGFGVLSLYSVMLGM